MTSVASYDVFDTVLTRLVGSPGQVFPAVGRRLRDEGLLGVDPAAYAAIRETVLQDLTVDIARHPSLERIAEEVADRLGLGGTTDQRRAAADRLVTAELDVEREVCRAVPGARERLTRSRRETGRGVVFVSDTPLPAGFLREVLVREDLFEDGDTLVTSAQTGASKQHGGLFDVVAADLGVAPDRMVHVGDDRWADLAHARMRGWQASLDTRARLTAREWSLDDAGAATGGLGPRLAAASRMARLRAAEQGDDAGVTAVAGGVALPLLAGYGLWVLQQARRLALDRLYFVSRDGEVFLEVTRQLAAQLGDPVECRYLYGSRRSWQLASTGTSAYDRERDLWIPDDVVPESLTARELLSLVDLPADAPAATGLRACAADRVDLPLGTEGWTELRGALAAGPLAAEVDRLARQRRDLLVRYLDQEGVTGHGRVGLVDVGWTGRAARSLEDVLVDVGRPLPAAHLFLGLQGSAPDRMGADLRARSHGWLLDESRGRAARDGAGGPVDEDPVMLVESFAMGREGHTVGYEIRDDLVVPQLVAAENPAAARWPFADFRRALGTGLDALLDGPVLDVDVDLRPLVWRELLGFWRRPSRAEARSWGAQPYGEDFDNARSHPLATPVTTRRMLTRLGVGRPGWREPTYWLAGTLELSPQPWRSTLRAVEALRGARRRLRRAPLRLRGEWAMRRGSGS